MFFFFQAEDGIRDLVRSRGLGDVYKRQVHRHLRIESPVGNAIPCRAAIDGAHLEMLVGNMICLLYTSDAADERSSVDLGGRRIIKKKNIREIRRLL